MSSFNMSLLKSIHNVLKSSKEETSATNGWKFLHTEFGVGKLIKNGKKISLSSRDFKEIRDIAIDNYKIDPLSANLEDLNNQSRTDAAGRTNDEKAISRAPRSRHVEIRGLSGNVGGFNHPLDGYMGIDIECALNTVGNSVLTIENFDTFISLKKENIPFISDDTIIMYRGDNQASPAAVKDFLNSFNGEHIHFGDFDSAGISIGQTLGKKTSLVLPFLSEIEQLKKLSKNEAYAQQHKQQKKIEIGDGINEKIKPFVKAIKEYQLAVTQESLVANKVKLHIVSNA